MQILYAHDVSGRDLDSLFFEIVQKDLSEDEGALEFARELTREVAKNREAINALITDKLQRWDFSRVALIDRLLIQMGITELMHFPEIPPKATINELIEIAKDFSTEESGKFINGLLHSVLTHLRESGELNKTGRGLIGGDLNGSRRDIKGSRERGINGRP
jgi:N utilization substance protein B